MTSVIDPREAEKARTSSTKYVDFYSEALKASQEFRKEYDGRMNVVKSADTGELRTRVKELLAPRAEG